MSTPASGLRSKGERCPGDICYKATVAGVPVEFANPRETNVTCRQCGQANREARNGHDFHCWRCDYQIHIDVNAAINVAEAGSTH